MKKDTLAVVIPVYGEKELVSLLYNRLSIVLHKLDVDYKIIYVNDDDPHGCEEELIKIAGIDSNVVVINLLRNFGEEFAVKAGLDYSTADWNVVMDCDLQDRPEDIPALYNKAKEGYEVVWGERIFRADKLQKKFLSDAFYFVFNLISDVKIKRKIGSFSIISSTVTNVLKENKTHIFNYIQAVKYLKFNEAYVPIVKEERPIGKSAYDFLKGLKLSFKILISSQIKILLFCVMFSTLLSLFCLIYLIFNFHILFNNILFLLFFNFILIISILGIYVYIQTKQLVMPFQYIIKNIINK